jgi:mannose-6-phosphate isomerase-like protein (cupin superfamily)
VFNEMRGDSRMTIDRQTLTRFDASQGPRNIGPSDGRLVELGSIGARMMAWTEETGGGFSLVEHPMPAKHLAVGLHKHSREDEYSYVLEGRMGALLGDHVVHADTGELVFKPRDQWHTFWNAGDRPCRILEIISPGGFEHCFDEMALALASPNFDPEHMAELAGRYGLELQLDSIPVLCAEHGLTHPMLATSP